jgi:very-short-patch-repair endonuclease
MIGKENYFYCRAVKEFLRIESDRARTEILEGYGLKVIRFTNDEVLNKRLVAN